MSETIDLAATLPRFCDRRNPQGQSPMTQIPPQAEKSTRTRRKDAYLATVKISIPLDMTNADSLANAIKAVAGIAKGLPEGSAVKCEASLGKV